MKRPLTQSLLFFVVMAAVFSIVWTGQNWQSLLAPLLAISLAYGTRNLFLSLAVAVGLGAVLVEFQKSQPMVEKMGNSMVLFAELCWKAMSDSTNLLILAFVSLILITLTVIIRAGGIQALVELLEKKISGPRSAQMTTYLMGLFLFIDDYANTMLVGSTMKNISDKYRVSREKLTFLVDATSAPVAGVALVSTWVGFELGLFDELIKKHGLALEPYGLFLDALGFRFYCFLMLLFVFLIIYTNLDFGPMKKAQDRAAQGLGVLGPDAKPLSSKSFSVIEAFKKTRKKVSTALVPLVSLIVCVFLGLFYDGGGFTNGLAAIFSFQNWFMALKASKNGIFVLFLSAGFAALLATLFALIRSQLPLRESAKAWGVGIKSSLLPLMILILAWSLKEICQIQQTGEFLSQILSDQISKEGLPALVFLASAVVAFSTGTSWGTMAILIPTVGDLIISIDPSGVFLAVSLAAILDGAILGDHCSPISDTTLMSTISTGGDLMDHVKTQLPYSLFIGGLALLCGYMLYPVTQYALWSWLVASFVLVGVLVLIKLVQRGRTI